MLSVQENFEHYTPPIGARRSIERLVSWLPKGHLHGLQAIVLTNSRTLRGKTGRVRGRKRARRDCLGFYHYATADCGAWIEIVVDSTLRPWPRVMAFVPFIADSLLGSVLFHEVGHHLETTVGAPSRCGEAAAEKWSSILQRRYLQERRPFGTRIARWVARKSRAFIARKLAEAKVVTRHAPSAVRSRRTHR